jgi:hypothetical protein
MSARGSADFMYLYVGRATPTRHKIEVNFDVAFR